jgi:phosphoglycolate phosphatase-like HAD superfamily hydrolase
MGGDRLVAHVAGDDVEARFGDDVRAEWKRTFQPMLSEINGFDGVRDVVVAAKDQGWTVALASSGDPDHAKHYLDLLDLHGSADDRTSAEDAEHTKPAPDLLLLTAPAARRWRARGSHRGLHPGLSGRRPGRVSACAPVASPKPSCAMPGPSRCSRT